MNCKQTDDALKEACGLLSKEQAADFAAHRKECPDCAKAAAMAGRLDTLIAALPDEAPSADFESRTLAAFARQAQKNRLMAATLFAVCAAISAAVMAGALVYLTSLPLAGALFSAESAAEVTGWLYAAANAAPAVLKAVLYSLFLVMRQQAAVITAGLFAAAALATVIMAGVEKSSYRSCQ